MRRGGSFYPQGRSRTGSRYQRIGSSLNSR